MSGKTIELCKALISKALPKMDINKVQILKKIYTQRSSTPDPPHPKIIPQKPTFLPQPVVPEIKTVIPSSAPHDFHSDLLTDNICFDEPFDLQRNIDSQPPSFDILSTNSFLLSEDDRDFNNYQSDIDNCFCPAQFF